jgi:hypothetical protein
MASEMSFFCTTSRRIWVAESQPTDWYRYHLHRIPFSRREYRQDAGERTFAFIVYVRDGEGEIEWAARCLVPRSSVSVERTLRRLGLRDHVPVPAFASRASSPRDPSLTGLCLSEDSPITEEECLTVWQPAEWNDSTQACIIHVGGEQNAGSSNPPPPPPADPPPSDPLNPPDPPEGGDGTPPPPPPPEGGGDCVPGACDDMEVEVSVTFGSGMVAPGGETTVTVQVSPPLAGWEVSWSSSVSGQDPSCGVPVGVFGATFGVTVAGGTFTTTYKAGLNVGTETVSVQVLNGPLNSEPNQAAAGLTVQGTCGNRADRIAYEYVLKNVNERPSSCQEFTQSGASANFSWPELNGRGPASNAPFGNLHFPHGEWGLVRESLRQGLEATRVNFGGRPISLTSGYRDPCGNANVDGVSQSLHMQGRAADMFPAGYRGDPAKLDTLWLAAEAAGGWGGKRYGHDRIHFQW